MLALVLCKHLTQVSGSQSAEAVPLLLPVYESQCRLAGMRSSCQGALAWASSLKTPLCFDVGADSHCLLNILARPLLRD